MSNTQLSPTAKLSGRTTGRLTREPNGAKHSVDSFSFPGQARAALNRVRINYGSCPVPPALVIDPAPRQPSPRQPSLCRKASTTTRARFRLAPAASSAGCGTPERGAGAVQVTATMRWKEWGSYLNCCTKLRGPTDRQYGENVCAELRSYVQPNLNISTKGRRKGLSLMSIYSTSYIPKRRSLFKRPVWQPPARVSCRPLALPRRRFSQLTSMQMSTKTSCGTVRSSSSLATSWQRLFVRPLSNG